MRRPSHASVYVFAIQLNVLVLLLYMCMISAHDLLFYGTFFADSTTNQKCSEKGIEKRSNRDFVICTGIVCTSLTHAHSFSAQKGRMSKMSVACRINVLLAIKMPKVFESKYL